MSTGVVFSTASRGTSSAARSTLVASGVLSSLAVGGARSASGAFRLATPVDAAGRRLLVPQQPSLLLCSFSARPSENR